MHRVEPCRGHQGVGAEAAALPLTGADAHLGVRLRESVQVQEVVHGDAAEAEDVPGGCHVRCATPPGPERQPGGLLEDVAQLLLAERRDELAAVAELALGGRLAVQDAGQHLERLGPRLRSARTRRAQLRGGPRARARPRVRVLRPPLRLLPAIPPSVASLQYGGFAPA